MSSAPAQQGSDAPWWADLPEPQATCDTMENTEVMQLLEKTKQGGKHDNRDFLLVDVRRTDWDGGTIATSINLPAQSFYQTRPIVYQLCKQAGITRVIFYCGKQVRYLCDLPKSLTPYPRELSRPRHTYCLLDAGLPE